jgi:hypothetical protein
VYTNLTCVTDSVYYRVLPLGTAAGVRVQLPQMYTNLTCVTDSVYYRVLPLGTAAGVRVQLP